MENFIKNSKMLATNPLGIIALFISMIYGFACLVVGTGGETLDLKLLYPFNLVLSHFSSINIRSICFSCSFSSPKALCSKRL